MKKPVQILLIVIAALFVLGIVKNGIASTAISSAISQATHVPVKIGGVNLSFLKASIQIKNLTIDNPSGFSDRRMVDIPKIFIDFEPGELFKGRAHFKEVRLELKELTVIRNKEGHLNVDAVKPTDTQKKQAKEKAKPASGQKPPKLMIDTLSLSIGRVVYKDYSTGGSEPVTQVFDINIQDRKYNNIDNPASVVSLLMFEALTRTTLSKLAQLDLDAFKEGGIKALSDGLGLVGDGSDVVQNKAKQLLNLLN